MSQDQERISGGATIPAGSRPGGARQDQGRGEATAGDDGIARDALAAAEGEVRDDGDDTAHPSPLSAVRWADGDPVLAGVLRSLQTNDATERGDAWAQIERFLEDDPTDCVLLAAAARVANECPFADTARSAAEALRAAGTDPVAVSAGAVDGREPRETPFYPAALIREMMESNHGAGSMRKEKRRELLEEVWVRTGRVPLMLKFLAVFPGYLQRFFTTYNFILVGDGPLPLDWRHFISIMAAASYDCAYVARTFARGFLECNGDPAWLEGGLDAVPAKLRGLRELNATLAYRPWRLTREVIAPLLRGGGTDAWTVGELVQVVVLMCTSRALCSFCYGCGIGVAPEAAPKGPSDAARTEEVLSLLKKCGEDEPTVENVAIFEREGAQEASDGVDVPGAPEDADMRVFCGEIETHEEFDPRSRELTPFKVQDYSWSLHGFSLAQQFYPGVADLLDDEFSYVFEMSERTFGATEGVDTTQFRQGVRHYTSLIYGAYHDDYNYQLINKYLKVDLKRYLKKVLHNPWSVVASDFVMGLDLRADEKVHVLLLAINSRRQAEILYALRALR